MSGVRLLALHGFSGTGHDFAWLRHTWEACPQAPPAVWYTPDLPGHGEAAVLPNSPGEEAFAATAAGCLDHADDAGTPQPPAPLVLIGYSMGGRVALDLACRFPGRVDALVLVGASPGLASQAAREERVHADQELAAFIVAEGVDAFADRWEALPLLASQKRIAEPWGARIRTRRRQQRAEGLAWALAALGTGVMPPRHADLERLTLPTLLVTGAEDPKFERIARAMLASLPDARHVCVPGAGHCAHLEAPAETVRAIVAFLADVLRPVAPCRSGPED